MEKSQMSNKPPLLSHRYHAQGTSVNPICSDTTTIYIKVKNSIIKKAIFRTTGCYTATKSAQITCKLAKRKNLKEAMKISSQEIIDRFPEDIPETKHHCAELAEQALTLAIQNFYVKHRSDCASCPHYKQCSARSGACPARSKPQPRHHEPQPRHRRT
jgi:NifU-like protein involved in Fe-S cluster formation